MNRTVGVEEEFLLVDPASGEARAVGNAVLREADDDAGLTGELQREQVETGTSPCLDLADLRSELLRTRKLAREAAHAAGVELAPVATSPLPVRPTLSSGVRYRRMIERFGLTSSEQLTCGCHVHVAIGSEEEGVAALDRIRPWLAPLLALSGNSPFWHGVDSGYASFRSQVWARNPSAGPTELFGSAAGYRDVTTTMLGTETLLDQGMLYFDARLSRTHPTLEVRVADVCREPDDAALIAGLGRALVETGIDEWQAGRPADPVRTEVLRLANWRAARSGLDEPLVDPLTWSSAPAAEVLRSLVSHVEPALERSGDLELVRELLGTALRRNNGAARQREVMRRTDDLAAVVADAVVVDQ